MLATGRVVEVPLCDLVRKSAGLLHIIKVTIIKGMYGVSPLDRTFAIHVMPHNNFGFRSQLCSWRLHIERGDLQHKISVVAWFLATKRHQQPLFVWVQWGHSAAENTGCVKLGPVTPRILMAAACG
ncbi:hypothetical protein DOS86_00740 [Anaplasma marginale]|uniref:hypothetical protein n=1 Tax=Anaplasma marginale TaxID=770 RepID=UPI0005A1654C|nr:hypothetical protein [Anaplasma marginale]KAB0453410.1 hypothetical protein FY192_00735 [Anaplasma marginale]RCL20252.1 hypothetical protein DOS86_00740 [Anaplasma marginale]